MPGWGLVWGEQMCAGEAVAELWGRARCRALAEAAQSPGRSSSVPPRAGSRPTGGEAAGREAAAALQVSLAWGWGAWAPLSLLWTFALLPGGAEQLGSAHAKGRAKPHVRIPEQHSSVHCGVIFSQLLVQGVGRWWLAACCQRQAVPLPLQSTPDSCLC